MDAFDTDEPCWLALRIADSVKRDRIKRMEIAPGKESRFAKREGLLFNEKDFPSGRALAPRRVAWLEDLLFIDPLLV